MTNNIEEPSKLCLIKKPNKNQLGRTKSTVPKHSSMSMMHNFTEERRMGSLDVNNNSGPLKTVSKNKPKSKFFRPWEYDQPICHICPLKTIFSRKSDLQRHVKTKHLNGTDTYNCQYCIEKFTRKDNLTRHLKTMHILNKVILKPKCQYCGKRLSRKDAVKRHERSCKSTIENFHREYIPKIKRPGLLMGNH